MEKIFSVLPCLAMLLWPIGASASVARFTTSTQFPGATANGDPIFYFSQPFATSGMMPSYVKQPGFAVHKGTVGFQSFGLAGAHPLTGSHLTITSNGSTGQAEGSTGASYDPYMTYTITLVGMMYDTNIQLRGVPSGDCTNHTITSYSGSLSCDSQNFCTCSGTAGVTSSATWDSTHNYCAANWFGTIHACWEDTTGSSTDEPEASSITS